MLTFLIVQYNWIEATAIYISILFYTCLLRKPHSIFQWLSFNMFALLHFWQSNRYLHQSLDEISMTSYQLWNVIEQIKQRFGVSKKTMCDRRQIQGLSTEFSDYATEYMNHLYDGLTQQLKQSTKSGINILRMVSKWT